MKSALMGEREEATPKLSGRESLSGRRKNWVGKNRIKVRGIGVTSGYHVSLPRQYIQ